MACKYIYRGRTFESDKAIISFIKDNYADVRNDFVVSKLDQQYESIDISKITVNPKGEFSSGNIKFGIKEDSELNTLTLEIKGESVNARVIAEVLDGLHGIMENKESFGTDSNYDAVKRHYDFIIKQGTKAQQMALAYLANERYFTAAMRSMGKGVSFRDGEYAVNEESLIGAEKMLNEVKDKLAKGENLERVSELYIQKREIEAMLSILRDSEFSNKVKETERRLLISISKMENKDKLRESFGHANQGYVKNMLDFINEYAKLKGSKKVIIPSEFALHETTKNEAIIPYFKDVGEVNIDYLIQLLNSQWEADPNVNIDQVARVLTDPNWKSVVPEEDHEIYTEKYINKFKTPRVQDYLDGKILPGRSAVIENTYGENTSDSITENVYDVDQIKDPIENLPKAANSNLPLNQIIDTGVDNIIDSHPHC